MHHRFHRIVVLKQLMYKCFAFNKKLHQDVLVIMVSAADRGVGNTHVDESRDVVATVSL